VYMNQAFGLASVLVVRVGAVCICDDSNSSSDHYTSFG
jgi:hypothetical protein